MNQKYQQKYKSIIPIDYLYYIKNSINPIDQLIEVAFAKIGTKEENVDAIDCMKRYYKTIEKEFLSMASLGNWIYEEDIGKMCSFLISNDGARISGQIISVDGNTIYSFFWAGAGFTFKISKFC